MKFITTKGTEIKIEIIKNKKLGLNGEYRDSAYHSIEIIADREPLIYKSLVTDAQHGLCIKTNRFLISVPANNQNLVTKLINDYTAHNDAVFESECKINSDFENDRNKIYAAMNLGE